MSENSSIANAIVSSEPLVYRNIKFYLFLLIEIPSVMISLYIIYKCLKNGRMVSRLNNHSIICLVSISLIETTSELPIALDYLRLGFVQIQTTGFCLFWIWYNFSIQTMNLTVMSWMSIERHLLIFHSNSFQNRLGRIKYHYIPMVISLVYIPIFYFSCIIIYQCENTFDYSSLLCGTICYNRIAWLSSFDWITNILIPSLLIPLSCLSLLIRVLIQIKKVRRELNWRSTRKMTIQLVIISLVYLIFYFPLALISLIRIYFIGNFLDDLTYYYFYYSPYLVQLFMPFVCLASLPEIWPKKDQIEPITRY